MTALAGPPVPHGQPAMLVEVPPPQTVAEAIASLHQTSASLYAVVAKLEALAERQQINPEMRMVVINDANNGRYVSIDRARWTAKSVGVINPGAAPVFVGVGGVSARPGSRAFPVPGAGAVVIPVEAGDLELGCDPAVLGAATAVVYLFRYPTVQAPTFG